VVGCKANDWDPAAEPIVGQQVKARVKPVYRTSPQLSPVVGLHNISYTHITLGRLTEPCRRKITPLNIPKQEAGVSREVALALFDQALQGVQVKAGRSFVAETSVVTGAIINDAPVVLPTATEDQRDMSCARWQYAAAIGSLLAGQALKVIDQDKIGRQYADSLFETLNVRRAEAP